MDAPTPQPHTERAFVPGLGRLSLTPFYDLVHRLGRVGGLHAEMIRLADPQPGQRLLDIGCATGNLLLAVGRSHPGVELIGIDPDLAALAPAQRKAARAGIAVRWDRGFAEELPYPDGSVDRVLSSLMLHHLEPLAKDATLAEVRRVLRPHGTLVLADLEGNHALHGLRRLRTPPSQLHDDVDLSGRIAAAGLRPEPPVVHVLRVGRVPIVRAHRD